ncbi:MAG: GntR family transcriptional regulator [Myxococcaceae bacterium]
MRGKAQVSLQRGGNTRSGRVRELIEESIATGHFPPGMRLEETMLAERFKVSRTPLREALFQLASVGIVEMTPHRGSVVAEVTPHQLFEMFEVMGELEGMCGRLAARRMSPAEHDRLLESLRACERASRAMDPDRYYYENQQFHHLIYAGTHNAFLEQQASALHRRLSPYRRLQLRVRDRVPKSFSEHEGIVSALIAGQPEQAAGLLREHTIIQGQRFADLIASLAGMQDSDAWRRAFTSSVAERKLVVGKRRAGRRGRSPASKKMQARQLG